MLGVFFLLYDTMFWVPTLNKNMLCIGSEWPKEINQSRGKSSKFGMSIFVFETVDFCWRNSSSMWTYLFFSFLKEVKGVVFSNLIVRQCEIASYLVSNIQKWNCFNHPKSSMSDCSPSKTFWNINIQLLSGLPEDTSRDSGSRRAEFRMFRWSSECFTSVGFSWYNMVVWYLQDNDTLIIPEKILMFGLHNSYSSEPTQQGHIPRGSPKFHRFDWGMEGVAE